jgi:hypothetical protein
MMAKIVFTSDFATKVKGDTWKCDSQLANQLVNVDKVAEHYKEKKVKEVKTDK